ncbi:penicillin-binding protein 2 [Candidatus Saccharibacteria bacterium oral taxon 955]|nr:penicillin-binding protein 2 [Candidatus Saccharibacteria bacterium oral taxon 955]
MKLHFFRLSRAQYIAIITVLLMALFVVRLFHIQVIQHALYVEQADSEHIKQFTLHAKRGEIYTMDSGVPHKLVMNETVYTVWADPTMIVDKQAVVTAINKIAGGNARNDFAKYLDVKKSRYQVLATKVSRKQAQMLKKENLPGIGFDAVSQRVYPEGQLASQVLGFVDAEGKGKYGFEQANDATLRGVDGMLKTVTDVRSVPLTVSDKNIKKPAVDGKNMVLTIDRNVQARVEQALADGLARSGAKKASAIVMDPQTGKILAMANLPTYDPGKLNEIKDEDQVSNDVITHPYEVGSDVKTFTMAMGIDKGVITPGTTYNNTDSIRIEDITIKNASLGHTGDITMQKALNLSLNTGVVTVAQLLGDGSRITRGARNTIYDYFYNRFRLGQVTGVELANESAGVVISPDHVQGNAVRYSNMVFGQGMDVTMLQVASGFSAIVNGGIYHMPTVIAGSIDQDGQFKEAPLKRQFPGVISASSSATIREMVHQAHYATYNPKGDGSERYLVGGKTGTSQTIINGKYVDNQTVGTYLGYGGEKGATPSYVAMVEISAPGKNMGGGADAKPIFNEISNWMLGYLRLTPKE